MTQEQKVRTRDEQEAVLYLWMKTIEAGIGSSDDPEALMKLAKRHILEAEARGASGASANVAALEAEIEGLKITLAHNDGIRNEKQKQIAALEARVKELERIADHACRCMSDSIEGLKAIEKGHVVQIWLRDEIEKIRAVLKCEGGV